MNECYFGGIINRLVMNPCREFVLKHADRCKKILKEFRLLVEAKKFRDRVFFLTTDFATHGPSQINRDRYQILDTEIKECLLSAAAKVVEFVLGY